MKEKCANLLKKKEPGTRKCNKSEKLTNKECKNKKKKPK
jgi:hypothetical protein